MTPCVSSQTGGDGATVPAPPPFPRLIIATLLQWRGWRHVVDIEFDHEGRAAAVHIRYRHRLDAPPGPAPEMPTETLWEHARNAERQCGQAVREAHAAYANRVRAGAP